MQHASPRPRRAAARLAPLALLALLPAAAAGAQEPSPGEGGSRAAPPDAPEVEAEGEAEDALDPKELLAEARRRERRATSDAERVELARWMSARGLLAESLGVIDGVLAGEPDREDALAFLRELGTPVRLPSPTAEREAFFRAAAGLPPAARELAVRELLSVTDPIALRADLERELAEGSPLRRGFAALALRRLFPGQAIAPLTARAVLDASDAVRAEAARALRAADDEAVAAPVLRALASGHGGVRRNAIEALADMQHEPAVPFLMEHLATLSLAAAGGEWRAPASHVFVGRQRAYIQDFDVEVAQNESIADPTIGTLVEGDVLDVRVLGVSRTSLAVESAATRRALASLTGASPGYTTRAWQRWWEEEGRALHRAGRPATAER